MGAKSPNGTRYLELFLIDYREIFGGKTNGGCRKCINNYLTKYKEKMKTTTANDSGFELKKKYEGIQIGLTGVTVNNKNITKDMALQLLQVHEAAKIFEKYPENIEEDLDAIMAEENKRQLESTNMQFAVAFGLNIDKDTKEKILDFVDKYKVPVSSPSLTKPLLITEVQNWLAETTPVDSDSADDFADEDEDNTNMQFAKADGFDLSKATLDEKAAFIEKYEIPFDAEREEPYTEDETTKLISDWLAEDALL